MKKFILFVIGKVLAIGLIVLGAYVESCHFGKSVPFGIKLPDPLMCIWSYTGGWLGVLIIAGGIYLVVKEYLEILIECIIEDKKNSSE